MKRYAITLLLISTISGCAYDLAGEIRGPASNTKEQNELAILSCKEQSRVAVSTAERQVGAFVAGLTIVGAPIAIEAEKSKAREVFAACMKQKGYSVANVGEKVDVSKFETATAISPLSGYIYGPPGVSDSQINTDRGICEATTLTEGDITMRRNKFTQCMTAKAYTVAPIGIRPLALADRGCTSSENATQGKKLNINGKTRLVEAVIGTSEALCKDPRYPIFVALTSS
ncbi:hypothetical protein ACO0LC_27925 [Undibacterium sp. JH2W]|uniref:hypothetical protein n=1 Tax=Undibacterium sp. JH2W TaxID=3413037 RepID=UPI003BEF7832